MLLFYYARAQLRNGSYAKGSPRKPEKAQASYSQTFSQLRQLLLFVHFCGGWKFNLVWTDGRNEGWTPNTTPFTKMHMHNQ